MKHRRGGPGCFLLTAMLVLGGVALWQLRDRNPPPLAASGGEPFRNFASLDTPFYRQQDERWKGERIGGSGETLGKVGCTVCSLAMALDRFGVRLNPGELNEALKANDGYTWRGWLKWDAVVAVSAGKVRVESLSAPTHHDIDSALKSGEPVLAKVFINGVIPHWVLVVGKDGTDYLTRDPMGDGHRLEPLTKFRSDVYGIRIAKPGAQ